ncbi:MAG: precorrin-6y C5,15-methyltransferase (decarboxylating) subunit CbiE [bacterium]|nr:precorrin-6y C5,15-methyltransferase (decarboxylating) subunit CbiE [bacterium]
MKKINIVGLGPGNRDYILPVAWKIIEASDIIIGGKRNIAICDGTNKDIYEITKNLYGVIEIINNNRDKKITVLASGDPGFYSILTYIKKYFTTEQLTVVPGISSLQYLFARLGFPRENAFSGSLHGRDINIIEKIEQYDSVALLTDREHSYTYIAQKLCDSGYGEKIMYVGNNLSYEDEEIIKETAANMLLQTREFNLCVVVISNE